MGCGKVSLIQALSPEQTAEMAMVDLAHMLLTDSGEPQTFQQILQRLAELKNMSQEQIDQMIVQIYTEINLDGRFVNIGDGLWGLKKWYPVEQYDDVTPTPSTSKSKRKLLSDDDFDDLDVYDLDEDYVDEYEDEELFEDEEVEDINVEFEDDELVDVDDFIDDVEIDFDSDDESLEELAEEEDSEDEEL